MNKRYYGIDVLKIISMHMVIILHIMGQGGCINGSINDGVKYYVNYLMETYSYAAVDIFAIITGFLSIKKVSVSRRKILLRWLQIEFYSIAGMIICLLLGVVSVTTINLKVILFPISYTQWGYATSYMLLLFFEPFINVIFSKISLYEMKKLFWVIIFISIWTTLTGSDFFGLQNGYAPLWIFLLYVIGGILRCWNDDNKDRRIIIPGCCAIICPLIAFIAKIILDKYGEMLHIENSEMFIRYTSPLILLYAISLVILFSNIETKRMSRIVIWGSGVSFGVYLGHTQINIRDLIWANRFEWVNSLPVSIMPVTILFLAITIFIVFGMCESGRDKVFSYIFKHLVKTKPFSE